MNNAPDFIAISDLIDDCYHRYVDTFKVDGEFPDMLGLKDIHTERVVANIEAIAKVHASDALVAFCCKAAARLHDVGRFEQLRRYGTFRDSESIDHAELSHAIIEREGWLEGVPGAECILKAVLFHNRLELPDSLSPDEALVANAVRDADKLDIFRVLEERVANAGWEKDCAAFWNLPISNPPNPVVVENLRAGESVDYRNIKSLADFVLIQVGWMIGGLHFAVSRRLCAERGHLEFRRDFLTKLVKDTVIGDLCDLAAASLRR